MFIDTLVTLLISNRNIQLTTSGEQYDILVVFIEYGDKDTKLYLNRNTNNSENLEIFTSVSIFVISHKIA